jgi:hypothetical protein
MTTTQIVVLVVVVVAAIALVLVLLNKRKSDRLRARFGPEYRRAVEETGSATRAEQRLAKLERRVERFNIRTLSDSERQQYADRWRAVQAEFVDAPQQAVAEADQLIRDVMTARGYPVADFDGQAADLSVNHPLVVEHYRAGHEIAVRHAQGRATTEDLRQAMIHYRKLFADLAGEPDLARTQITSRDSEVIATDIDTTNSSDVHPIGQHGR